jgi:Anti-sigma-K factor rskA
MTDGLTNEEREALIAGDRAGLLQPDEADELAFMAELLADPSTWVEPNANLENAVVVAVAAADSGSSTSAPPTTTRASGTAGTRRRRIFLSAVAAAATFAIVLGVFVATRTSPSADYAANLAATGSASGARASAEITRTTAGFRVALDAHGLPALPDGEYYQAWLKNAAGTLVPIGTFSSSDGRVTLWSGVSPKEFPTMTVTIEKADNIEESSGVRVLIGEVHAG